MNSLIKLRKEDILADGDVNRCRQIELDVMRVILVFLMISIHVEEVIFSKAWEDFYYIRMSSAYKIILIFINATVAPAFMFAMGASMQFSRSPDPGKMIRRGLKLILIWFLLKVAYIYPLGLLFAEAEGLSMGKFCISYVFNSDILFFAGAFLIYYGLIKKYEISDIGFTVITLLLFLAGHFLHFKSGSLLAENLMGQFVWTEATCFSFLNWIIKPFLGTLWGKILIRCKNKNALYTVTGMISAMFIAMFIFSLKALDLLTPERLAEYADVEFFYHCNFLTVLFTTACLGVLTSICYLISRGLSKKAADAALYISSKTNEIYILQWLIIPWLAIILPRATRQYSPVAAYALGTAIFAVCILITVMIQRIKTRKTNETKPLA